jgi:hypothetical protein
MATARIRISQTVESTLDVSSSLKYGSMLWYCVPGQCYYLSATRPRDLNLRCGRAQFEDPSVYCLLIIAKFFD